MTVLGEAPADPFEWAARQFEHKRHKHPSPLALAKHLDPRTGSTPMLRLIDSELVALADGLTPHNALMVFVPSQEGKSTLCARRFPEWLLQDNPSLRIGIISYQAEIATRWGRDIKRDIAQSGGELGIELRDDSQAAGRWQTPEGGGVYSVGVGGSLTGVPLNCLLIDDPVKDRAAAESATVRNATWDWWESVALTRLAPNSITVCIMTRWHQDDLAGRILSRPSVLRWKTIKIPAIATADDPLGREPGEELESVRGREAGYFWHMRATMSPYVFSSIYQQSPTAPEGNFFRRPTFRYWRHAPPWNDDGRERIDREGTPTTLQDCWMFGTVDVAASTKTSADFTVVSIWCVTPEGDLVLLDRRRQQVAEHDHFTMARKLFAIWGRCQLFVERHFFATTLIKDALADNIPVVELEADTDKVTRAIPAAARVHSGRVWFPAETSGCECGNCDGAWLDEWCDELASFPSAEHDDQTDTLSYAARVLTMEWTPAKTPPRPGLHPSERTVAEATRSSTGYGQGIDLMNTPW